ncbi:RraA family protein [Glaciibacter superstes]|uniref:RraA family protein n=1 Tax=Glaciibacter superstes TaxID=501023 RepID=UPI0003B68F44|nr:methyltransferase [Glaciibacter superstes]
MSHSKLNGEFTVITIDRSLIQIGNVGFDRAELTALFADIPVANLGDAMDRMGVCDAGVRAMWRGARCVGNAFPVTVRAGDNAGLHVALEHLRQGDVLVVNGGGDLSRALLGDLLATKLTQIGVAGVVVDGCIRDRSALENMKYPVWARGVNPAGPYKNGPAILGHAAAIGGVVVHPGDIVAADDDGVAFIPVERAQEILSSAHAVVAREAEMASQLAS